MARKQYTVEPSVPTIDLVAKACIAFRDAGNTIVSVDRDEVVDENGVVVAPKTISNKRRMCTFDAAKPITQADRDFAQEVIDYVGGSVTMQILAGKKVSDFMTSLAKVLAEETSPPWRIGLIVYAPNVYFAGKKNEVVTDQTMARKYTSQSLGPKGQKVALAFTLIQKKYLSTFNCYSAFGEDDKGNLVSFLTQHEELCASGNITGKIKGSDKDKWHSNAIVTQLNYVKASA